VSSQAGRTTILDAPRYGLTEAARYIPGLSAATLRTWVLGRTYAVMHGEAVFKPLIELPDKDDRRLSFTNLIEAHVLYGLRVSRGISIRDLRTAIDYAEKRFGITHLLAHRDLLVGAGNLFIERYGELVNLGKGGQLAMKKIIAAYLERVQHDSAGFAQRFFPIVPWAPGRLDFLIDPEVAFGKPIIAKLGVRVTTIADRYEGDEPLEVIARDYGLEEEEVEAAITYARAA
jgi:uncharacterized protein (DUF433 family)